MKCKEIIAKIEETYPKERAESWDNPGLLVGDEEQEVKKVFLALDVTFSSACRLTLPATRYWCI